MSTSGTSGTQQPVSLSTEEQQPVSLSTEEQKPVSLSTEGQQQVPPGEQQVYVSGAQSQWEVPFCDLCAGGAGPFCYGCCCPNCANASARSTMDGSDCCFNCLCMTPCAARWLVRDGYHIEGNAWMDTCAVWCCPCCVSCQLFNESSKRGPRTGYYGTNRSDVEVPWNIGLFNVCEDMNHFLLGLFCIPCANAWALSKFNESPPVFDFCFMGCCLSRGIIREGYNIEGSCVGDMFIPLFCLPCTACQLLNEVKSRGNIKEGTGGVVQQSIER